MLASIFITIILAFAIAPGNLTYRINNKNTNKAHLDFNQTLLTWEYLELGSYDNPNSTNKINISNKIQKGILIGHLSRAHCVHNMKLSV